MSEPTLTEKLIAPSNEKTPHQATEPTIETLIETPAEPPPYKVVWGTLPVNVLTRALQIGSECGCNPRDIKKAHAGRLFEAVERGDWKSGVPDIVCLCRHGGICNGRHRATVARKANVPLTGWVGIDVPQDVIDYTDSGLKRQPGDALGQRGVKKYRLGLGAAIRLLRLYDAHRDTHWTKWGDIRFSTPKIGQLFDQHYSWIESIVDHARQIESGTHACPSATFAFAFLVKREGGWDKLAEVAHALAVGTGRDVDLPLVRARTRLTGEATSRNKKADRYRGPYELGLLLTALEVREKNLLADEKDRKKTFTFGEKAPMPDLFFPGQLEVAA